MHQSPSNFDVTTALLPHLRVRLGHGEALHPLLRIGPVLSLQDKGAVVGEDFEGLGNVAPPLPSHFHRTNGAHVQRLRHARFPTLPQKKRSFTDFHSALAKTETCRISLNRNLNKFTTHSFLVGELGTGKSEVSALPLLEDLPLATLLFLQLALDDGLGLLQMMNTLP